MKPLLNRRVLSISVHSQSLGFVAFAGPQTLIDWGVRSFRGGVNTVKIPMKAKLSLLFDVYRPDAIVVSEPTTLKRRKKVHAIVKLAQAKRIPVKLLSWKAVQPAFPADNQNKYHVAAAIAARYPELLPCLPAPRKTWQSEEYGIDIFEATEIGVVYYSRKATATKT